MEQRRLGTQGLEVSALGLGCMGFTGIYGPAEARDPAAAIATVQRALDLGITFFDTAEVYGPWENERLLGRALKGRREQAVIATKFGFRFDPGGGLPTGVDSSPANVRAVCEAALERLGVDHIDLFYQHRVDPKVPIEEVVGAMAELVRAGKVRYLGLSEVSAATLRRACRVHPITALQSEYSLWERGVEHSVLPACRELGVGFVAYCPLGRGLLTNVRRSAEEYGAKGDFRRSLPRFQGEALERNQALAEALRAFAHRKGITAAQLSLAWLLQQGPDIVPIPGTTRAQHLAENVAAAAVRLPTCDQFFFEEAFPRGVAAGDRYTEAQSRFLDQA